MIQLRIGARPWLPSDETRTLEVFDRCDFPTCGLILQGSEFFVFDCAEGHATTENVWVYAHVSQEEADALRTTEGTDFRVLLNAIFQGDRDVTAALAIQGRIYSSTPVSKTEPSGQPLVEDRQLHELQAYGRRRTAALGIQSADVPDRIREFLKGKKVCWTDTDTGLGRATMVSRGAVGARPDGP